MKYSNLDTVSKTGRRYELYGREIYRGEPVASDNERFVVYKGQTLDAKKVFMEGWKARARADEAGVPSDFATGQERDDRGNV